MKNKNNTLANEAFIKLEELIVTLKLEPGQIVSENELSELLDIGRMPVREAIKTLEYMHLVKTIPYKGIIITEVKIEEMFLQMEVRRVLEKLIAMRAAKFATKNEKKELSKIKDEYLASMEADDSQRLLHVDGEFHALLSKMSRNPYATSSLSQLLSLDRRLYFISHDTSKEVIEKINRAHIDLMEAILNADMEQAGANAEALVDTVKELYYSNIGNLSI